MVLIFYPLMWFSLLIVTVNVIQSTWIAIVVMIASMFALHYATALIGHLTGDHDAFGSSPPFAPWMTVQRQVRRLMVGKNYGDDYGYTPETKESPLTFGLYAMLITTPFLYMITYDMFSEKSIAYFGSIGAGALIGFMTTRRIRKKLTFKSSSYDFEDLTSGLENEEEIEDEEFQKACKTIAREEHWSQVLYLDRNATFEEVKKARRELLKEYHPDKNQNRTDIRPEYFVENTRRVNKAFEDAKKELG